MEKIDSVTEFVSMLNKCETQTDSYDLFKKTSVDVLKEYAAIGRRAVEFGYGLTMRDEFLLRQAENRISVERVCCE